jgi:DNA-binding NtrC family response regulator
MTAKAKILLVDDEAEFVAILARRLGARNYSVSFACSGKHALAQIVRDKHIEVVLLDVEMPELDGIETLKRIKKQYPLIEVIMLTGHSTIDSAIGAIKLGAYDYLLKPVELMQLVAKIENAAGRKRRRDQLILQVQITPYLTSQERAARIADILNPHFKSRDD